MQMQTPNGLNAGGMGWLGFELSVLRRLKFGSVALPLAGEPNLGRYLKRWDARVQAIGGGATEVMLEEVAKRI